MDLSAKLDTCLSLIDILEKKASLGLVLAVISKVLALNDNELTHTFSVEVQTRSK